jgi:phage gp36-like protein
VSSVQYATAADFAKHGLPPQALDGFAGDLDQLLVKASAKFNTYARGRYTVPFSVPYPDEVVEAVCVLAAYSVMTVRGYDPNSESDISVENRYRDLIGRPNQKGWLQDLSSGRVCLAIDADPTPTKSEGGPIVINRTTSSGVAVCDRWAFDQRFW